MQSKGFTIIEVLVVAAMIVVFSIILISNFPQARLQFALSRAAYKFEQDVRKAQADAFSSTRYTDAEGNEMPLGGYGIHVDVTDNKKYVIYGDMFPQNQRYDNQDYIIETIDLAQTEPGIIIKEIKTVQGNDVSINFTPPNPITTIGNGADQSLAGVDIVFTLEGDQAKTKTVSINTSGLIQIK
jgi:type II secretory pathway pseudopilin PulG